MNKFTRKGYGRIYVRHMDDIQRVTAIIREMDAYEFEYLPANIIAMSGEYPKVVYTGKFDDLDLDALTATCWNRGIFIWCFDARNMEFPPNDIKKPEEAK